MFVSFLTKRVESKLSRRKGGASGHGSSAAYGAEGGESATPFSNDGGKVTTIPAGSPFAGREASGGTRAQVYGNSMYGSGYPGVAWGGVARAGGRAYLHDSERDQVFVDPFPSPHTSLANKAEACSLTLATSRFAVEENAIRHSAMLLPSSTGTTTSHLVADTTTVSDLIDDITSACSSSLNKAITSTSPITFNDIAETRISYRIRSTNTTRRSCRWRLQNRRLPLIAWFQSSASPTALSSLMDSGRIINVFPGITRQHIISIPLTVALSLTYPSRANRSKAGRGKWPGNIDCLAFSVEASVFPRKHQKLALARQRNYSSSSLPRAAKILYPARLSDPAKQEDLWGDEKSP
ncbi:hypothetical protein C8J56DRAFT_1094672 [Mycena floridula]|nr:hypothetical protein C8J56DRAFT_1094672 [Mycena floridula]